jgi:hypothetical protein
MSGSAPDTKAPESVEKVHEPETLKDVKEPDLDGMPALVDGVTEPDDDGVPSADPSAEMAKLVEGLPALNAAMRSKLGLCDAGSRSEAIEHVMWGMAEKYMGLETPDVEYEMRTFRCKLALNASTLLVGRDEKVTELGVTPSDTFVTGVALPLGWQAKGFVRQVELYWPDAIERSFGAGRVARWSLPETKERKLAFDGRLLDFYRQGFANGEVREVLAVNGTFVSKMVRAEYSELSWDSYTRKTLYVWFEPPLKRAEMPSELPVRVTYYRAVFDDDDD